MTDLAGHLTLRPGRALPSIASTRRQWAPTLGRGRPADALPDLLGAVFTLCGGAHRVAARLAVQAARQGRAVVTDELRQLLRVDTQREHLRRLWLDLPCLLPAGPEPDAAELAGCPVLQGGADPQSARQWLQAHVLGEPLEDWLAGWQRDPAAQARRWTSQGATGPARTLQALRPLLVGPPQRVVALQAHASPIELQRLAAQLRREADFALAPTWRGHTAETGCWTRAADTTLQGADSPCADPWMRHAARLADLARLAAADGLHWLSLGGLALGEREGLGWCEMARGLLIHWVCLDDQGRVADCRLIAPTEWNFHPFGPAARALTALPPQASDAQVRALAAAYDPCVAVDVDRSSERSHA